METERRQRLLAAFRNAPVSPESADLGQMLTSEYSEFTRTHRMAALHDVSCRGRWCKVVLRHPSLEDEMAAQPHLSRREVFRARGCSIRSLGSNKLTQTLILNCSGRSARK